MSYMEEWQKQQKALKDAEREQKKGAAKNLTSYRSKQQGAWQQRQREMKEADRKNREQALASLKKYKGGEHDIKEYQRIIAQYKKQLLEQSKKLHAKLAELEPDMPNEMAEESWREHFEQHMAEFEKMIRENGFEDFKELDLSSPRNSISSFARGSPADARASDFSVSNSRPYQEFIAEAEEEPEKATKQAPESEGNPSEQSADVPIGIDSTMAQSPDPAATDDIGYAAVAQKSDGESPATPSRLNIDAEKEYETPDATTPGPKAVQSCPENKSKSEVDQLQSPPRSVSRLIDLDFSFGIIYPSISPAPTIDACSTAAASIVPASLEKTLQQTLPTASWDSNLQPVLKSVKLDRHFHQQGAIRYVVRGSVPVHMAINDVPSPMRRQLTEEDDLLIGGEEDQRWRRVRNGNSPDWESILSHKMGHIV